MIRRNIIWWGSLVASCILTIGFVVFSTYNIASAASLSDFDTARNNTAVKILARNLSDCWKNAQQNVDFSSNNSWKYDSSVYWSNPNMLVYYPKILAGKTGNESSSICADMITGWKTNWIVKLFTDRGDFVGLDENVVIPGDWDNEEVFWDNMNAMKTYLTGTGYKKESVGSTALDGYQCLYFHLDAYKNVFRDTKNKIIGGLFPAPASAYDSAGQLTGPFNFISRETYCVPMADDGEHIDFSSELKVYLEEDDLGNGLDREGSSRNKLSLDWMYMNDFRVDKFVDDYNFVVTINEIYGYYQIYDANTGEKRQVDEVQDSYLKIANNNSNSGCFHRFSYKSWFLGSWQDYCSLSNNATSINSISLTFDQFKNRFSEYLRGMTVTDPIEMEGPYVLFASVTPKTLSPDKATAKFTKGAESDFVKYFFDASGDQIVSGGYALDTAEQYMFYYDHLKDYFGKNITTYLFDNAGDAADTVKVIWIDETNGRFETKYLSMGTDKTKKACALDSSNAWDGQCSTQHDWVYFAEKLGDFTEEELMAAFEDIEPLDQDYKDAVDPDGGTTTNTETTCMSSGAAQTLGWIVCPVLDFMKNASESLYNGFVEPALTVEPQLFTRNSTSGGAWSGWETFRNIANILLSILILVVIFSQLTGYGIDNYGIKKILPKIIVAAVLMNLSYWICIALVDVSNIFGNSLQAFFDGLAGKVTLTDAAKWGLGDAASSAAATVFLPAALLTALAGMIFAVAMEGGLVGLLLALFVGAIAVVISILFLFILLAAREAAIVILTVLSPLALACFMLPNTKRLFDKWWKLFYSLLLVYPICGVLVGGGNYVSKLLLAAGAGEDGFFSAFMAMIIGVVPIFFIPTVLKGSLNMMGQLGAKISGFGTKMGNRISGDANRAVKGSERYKNYQDDRARMRKINAANRDINNLRGRDNLNDRQKRRLAQSMAIVANERENEASRHNMIHGGYDARLAGAEAKADAQRVADIESMLSTGRMNVDGQAVEADSGEGVNSNSPASLAAFHKAALARHASATTAEERSNAMAQIRAVQNMMSKTDAGRAAVMGNLADAVTRAQNANDYSTSKMAASHLMSDFGDLYKTKNRGAHSMIKDLSNDAQMGDVQASIRNGTYDAYGVDKYTEETLAGADDAALDKLIAAMNPIVDADGNTVRGASLTGESLETLQNTAYQALEKSKAGTLNIKPEVAAKLEQIRNGYVPQGVTQAQQQSQSAQQQAQNIQDSILQELQNINTELHNQNRGDNGGQPKPPTILGPDGKPLT